jgi:pSer/pThr/pTyr-binding forkhead associated (FHA) protein
MKSKLDQLERYLTNIIEKGTSVLWRDNHTALISKLIAAIEAEADSNPDAKLQIPDALVIQLHPKKYAVWQEENDWVKSLSAALHEAAVELDLPFNHRPVVSLETADDISENDLKVLIIQQQNSSNKTAILAAENSPDAKKPVDPLVKAFFILENGDHFQLDKPVTNIGRRANNDLNIDDLHISREHAQIRASRGTYVLFDLNSKGGTYVNGRKVIQHTLHSGDVISLSGHPIIFIVDRPENEENTSSDEVAGTTRISTTFEEDKDKQ